MDIRTFSQQEYENSKRLWAECFPEDGASFINWYYSKRSKAEYCLGAFDGDKLISMLHIIPMRMKFGQSTETVGFVSGVCTTPKMRQKGVCGSVFASAFEAMRQKGYAATVLQPFDTAFYERFGYRTYITRATVSISASKLKLARNGYLHSTITVTPNPILMLQQYNSFMSGRQGYSLRDENYFSTMIEEYSLDDALIVCGEHGYCVGYAEGDSFFATELVVDFNHSTAQHGYGDGKSLSKAIALLLPQGFCNYQIPLPTDISAFLDWDSKADAFSMLAPLRSDFTIKNIERMYGFDRY